MDDDEMAMVARKVIELLKKAGWQFKKGSTSKVLPSDRDNVSGCFKCGKYDHVVKNYSLQNEEQGSEQLQNYAKRPQQNKSAGRPTKAMMAA